MFALCVAGNIAAQDQSWWKDMYIKDGGTEQAWQQMDFGQRQSAAQKAWAKQLAAERKMEQEEASKQGIVPVIMQPNSRTGF